MTKHDAEPATAGHRCAFVAPVEKPAEQPPFKIKKGEK